MIPTVDTSALRAILRGERRRAALAQLESASFIDVHTVARLRDDVFADGVADREDAEALFAVERRGVTCCVEWRDFFVAAMIDHVCGQGPVTIASGEWLLKQADRTRTVSAFAILLGVLDAAGGVPARFVSAVAARAEGGWPGLAELAHAA